jgi:phage recombination protein Bet
MNQIAVREPQSKLMLLDYMADKYSLKPDEFSRTVRATCGLSTATPEQVAAFLIVAKEYDLNPLTKEIYAFPGKGGGIVPIVSIDGWVNLVNSHPQCDGFDFAVANDSANELYSMTCTMYRKDRAHPTIVTEYFEECKRATEPWKMKHRMLRHKSFIQAARYAFGFAGIYDEDEGRTIAEAIDVTPKERPRVPSPSEMIDAPSAAGEGYTADTVPAVTIIKPDPISSGPQPDKSPVPDIKTEYDGWFKYVLDKITHATDGGWLETFWNETIEPFEKDIFPSDRTDLANAYGKAQGRLNEDGQ